jgi:hypothetical protein
VLARARTSLEQMLARQGGSSIPLREWRVLLDRPCRLEFGVPVAAQLAQDHNGRSIVGIGLGENTAPARLELVREAAP